MNENLRKDCYKEMCRMGFRPTELAYHRMAIVGIPYAKKQISGKSGYVTLYYNLVKFLKTYDYGTFDKIAIGSNSFPAHRCEMGHNKNGSFCIYKCPFYRGNNMSTFNCAYNKHKELLNQN